MGAGDYEFRLAQHVDMFHYAEARELREAFDDFGCGARAVAQEIEDGTARGIGERFPYGIERISPVRCTRISARDDAGLSRALFFLWLARHLGFGIFFQFVEHFFPAATDADAVLFFDRANRAVA